MKKSLPKFVNYLSLICFLLLATAIFSWAQPTFTSVPAGGATGVNQSGDIVLTFSEPIRDSSPGNAALTDSGTDAIDNHITLKITNGSGTDIPFDATINGGKTIVTINPSANLPSGAVIFVAVADVEAISNDNDITPNPTTFTFTVIDYITPTITFNPAAGAVNVAIANNLVISFDEAVRNINDSDIDNANVGSLLTLKLTNAAGADVPFTATINAGDDQITIDPTSNLNPDQVYYLNIAPVEDASDNATTASNITFTTIDTQPPVPTFNPLNGATGVVETNNIVINFNEAIRRASDDFNMGNTSIDGRITLKFTDASGANIPFDATINASDDQVTIDPTSALPGNTVIYVAITGVEDGNDNLINPDPASITFTTGDTQPPTLTFNPANSATGVSVSSNLTITFNEAIRNLDNSAISAANLLTLVDFKLTNAGGADVPFTASIDGTNTIVTVDPTSNLAGNQVYFLRMNPIEDGVDNATSAQSITFTSEPPPSFSGGPFSPSSTCVGDNIVISGNNFGAAVPTVTINGTSTTPAEIIAHTNNSITFKTLAGMATGNNETVTVLNNTNGLSRTSVSTVTINPTIASSLPISSNPLSPAVGQSYDIDVANTQNWVSYEIRELPGAFGGSKPGTGGTITFSPYSHGTDGTYQYEVRATSSGCTQQIYSASVVIAALAVNAGADKTICAGDSVILGDNPTAAGGTGFYNFTWNTVPPSSNFSNASNPLVKPTTTTTYRVTLKDSPAGTPKTDNITITVNPKPAVAFNPTTPTNYNVDQAPYQLSAVVTPANGSGLFSGTGVVQHADNNYYFHPDLVGIQNNIPITYTHTNTNGCSNSTTMFVNVLNNQSPVLNLDDLYCSNETQSATALAANPVVVNMTWYRTMRFLDSNQNPVPDTDPNYPLTEVVGSNPKTYLFDPIKAAAILSVSGNGKFYIGVYGDISIPPFINILDILIGIDASSISFPGIVPTIQGIQTGTLLCKDANVLTLTASTDGNGYNTVNYSVRDYSTNALLAPNPITQPTPGQYKYNPNTVTYPSNESYRLLKIVYDYTDQNGCNGTTDNFYFYNIRTPNAPVANDQQYCQFYDAGKLTLSATGEYGDFLWYENSNLSDASPGRGAIFDTGLNSLNPLSKTYYVTDNFAGCASNSTSVIVQVTPVPSINLSIPPQCENRIGTFNGPSGTIVSYSWDLGDGTSANTQSVQHAYDKEGAYDVALRVVFNSNGQSCPAADTVQVTVGRNPKPSFTFNQVCDGDNTQFLADANIPVQKFEWTFGDGDFIAAGLSNSNIVAPNNNSGRSGGTYKNPTHRYLGGPQNDSVMVKAFTTLGCFDSTKVKLTILPFLSFSSSNPYIMKNLDSEKGFWTIEDAKGNSTWEFAKPADTILKSNDFAWVTNADGEYLPNDLSYVNSPCFNISGITKPVLTLDYLSNTPKGSDGAVLQYSTNGIAWLNVGSIGSGKKWFNEVGIPFGGGNNQGWSGDLFEADTSWVEGKRILDDITPRSKIRFRVAFYSSQEGQLEGFAFRNVKIEPRNRQLLVENFTNVQAPQVGQNNNAFYNLPSAEIVKLEYHTSFPAEDDINNESSEDQNSRAAFYGLTNGTANIPRVYLDGESSGNLVPSQSAWFFDRSLFRALDSSPYEITPSTLSNMPDSPDKFIVHASIKANQIVIGKPIVHIVVLEKTVGSNQFVVRKFLPHAAGTPLPEGILATPDSTFSLTKVWQVNKINTFSEIAVVVFVQDEITKEVYQAEYLENPGNLPSVITGVEPGFTDLISIYPNPAKDEVNIELPRSYTKSLPVKMVDAFGREVYNASFNIGEQKKTVKTEEFASGVYIIQIKSATGEVVRKKVIISN